MSSANKDITGIVIALKEETRSLTNKPIKPGEFLTVSSHVLVACSGAGPDNAHSAAKLLIANGASRLISWGCAAALNPDFKPGDLIIPRKLISENKQLYSTCSKWYQYIVAGLSTDCQPYSCTLTESSRIVASRREKFELQRKTSANAVDMETIAVAKAAKQFGLPFLAIRAIADPAMMDLPLAITHSVNEKGQVDNKKLFRFIVSHPHELIGLIKLGFHFRSAMTSLKTAARHIEMITSFKHSPIKSHPS